MKSRLLLQKEEEEEQQQNVNVSKCRSKFVGRAQQ